MLTELKNRCVEDVLMLVCGRVEGPARRGRRGLAADRRANLRCPSARASFRHAGRQDWDKIAKALKPVYTAPTEGAATSRVLEFSKEWGNKYPAIVRLWENACAEFVPFLQFDAEIRRIACTTSTIESRTPRIRRAVRAVVTSRPRAPP